MRPTKTATAAAISSIAFSFLSLPCPAGERGKAIEKGAIEGYIRDESGNPFNGTHVSVAERCFTTQGGHEVIPLYIPNTAVGAIVFDEPDRVNTHCTNKHSTKTDKRGHYSLGVLAPGYYSIWVWQGSSKLMQKYSLPTLPVLVVVTGGQNTVHDVVVGYNPHYRQP